MPEELDSRRMVWTLGLWTTGRLDSVDARALYDWMFGLWALQPWTPGHLESGRLDTWILDT